MANGLLNSKTIQKCVISYKDSEVTELGDVNACIKDAIQENKIPKNDVFFGNFIAGGTYLMLGYRYYNEKYGTIILYGYRNTVIRANIANDTITIS